MNHRDVCGRVRVFTIGEDGDGCEGTIVKVGRSLVTIAVEWDFASPTVFRIETGVENDTYGRRWFRTYRQLEAEGRPPTSFSILTSDGTRVVPRPCPDASEPPQP